MREISTRLARRGFVLSCNVILLPIIVIRLRAFRGFLPQGFPRKNPCLFVSFISRYYLTSGIRAKFTDTRFETREVRVFIGVRRRTPTRRSVRIDFCCTALEAEYPRPTGFLQQSSLSNPSSSAAAPRLCTDQAPRRLRVAAAATHAFLIDRWGY